MPSLSEVVRTGVTHAAGKASGDATPQAELLPLDGGPTRGSAGISEAELLPLDGGGEEY